MLNKVALITGSSRGIGKATAYELAKRGYNVVINCKSRLDKALELAKKISKDFKKIKTLVVKADVSNKQDVDDMVDAVLKNFGRIDVLVNNAGICIDKDFSERTLENFEETFRVNLFGPFLLSQKIGSIMKQNKYGKILNVSSNNSLNCFHPTSVDYDCSKIALNMLTKELAIEFAPYVNVNAIAPGWVKTDMNIDLSDDFLQIEKNRISKQRFSQPEEIANLIAFLVSDEADYINGEIVAADGFMHF